MTRHEQQLEQLIEELMYLSTARSFPGKVHLLYETIRLLYVTWQRAHPGQVIASAIQCEVEAD